MLAPVEPPRDREIEVIFVGTYAPSEFHLMPMTFARAVVRASENPQKTVEVKFKSKVDFRIHTAAWFWQELGEVWMAIWALPTVPDWDSSAYSVHLACVNVKMDWGKFDTAEVQPLSQTINRIAFENKRWVNDWHVGLVEE